MNARWKVLMLLVTSCLLVAGAAVASPLVATIKLSPSSGSPGTDFHCNGSGYAPSETVNILWDGQQIATAKANAGGKFFALVTVPAAALPGTHTVEAKGARSGRSARATFKVTTNWLQLGFDALRSGLNPYENVLNPQNVSSIVVDWAAQTGGPVRSSPVLYSGKLYVGSDDGGFYKADPTTGEVIAIIKTGGPIVASPAVIKGFNPQPDPPGKVVFVSTDGKLYALGTKTDRLLWSKAIGDPGLSSPLVIQGADDRSTRIIVGTSDGKVMAFDGNGQREWQTWWGKSQQLTPGAYDLNDHVFVGVGDTLLKVSTVDGKVLSSMALDGVMAGGPAIGDVNGDRRPSESLFGTDRGTLYAIDTESFKVDWTFPLDGAANGTPALGDVDGDGAAEVLIGTDAGNLHAIKVVRGRPVRLWSVRANGSGFTPPVMANGVVYAGTQKAPGRPRDCGNCVQGWDWRTGEELFRLRLGGRVLASPIVVDGSVFLGADDGTIYGCSNGGMRSR